MSNFYGQKGIYPQHYKRYLPTSFDDNLTILEKVNKIIYFLNSIGWDDETLLQMVLDQLKKWLEDGTLADLINKALLQELQDKVNKNTLDIAALQKLVDELRNKNLGGSAVGSASLYQNKLTELFFGFNGSEIFSGAEDAPQGLAYAKVNGVEKLYVLSRVQGTGWLSDERSRITEFNLSENGSVIQPVAWSQVLTLGHQGLSAIVENGQVILFAGANTGSDTESVKGYTKIVWNGSNTSQSHVSKYTLIGTVGSGHALRMHHKNTPCVSSDGRYIVFMTQTSFAGNARYCLVYDRKEVEASSNPLNVMPLNVFKTQSPKMDNGHIVQDVACDGNYIYILRGYYDKKDVNLVHIYTVSGYEVGYFHFDAMLADYTDSQLNGGGSLGLPTQLEPEGIDIRDGKLLVLMADVWKNGATYTRRSKVLYEIKSVSDKSNDKSIKRGYIPYESSASLHVTGSAMDLTYPFGDTFMVGTYNEKAGTYRNRMGLYAGNALRLFDGRDGADNEDYSAIKVIRNEGRVYTEYRAKNGFDGGGLNLYGSNDSEVEGNAILYSVPKTGAENYNVRIQETGMFRAGTDGGQSLGTANYRWNNIYATGNMISTSDREYKDHIADISDLVLDAWAKVNFKQYKFKDAIALKGEEAARIHIGVVAQDIYEAFESVGLNAFDYGIIGYDEWEAQEEVMDESGFIVQEAREAGNRWSIRADECQFLEMALLRRELERLKGI